MPLARALADFLALSLFIAAVLAVAAACGA